MVKISHSHGFLSDCYDTTNWVQDLYNMDTGDATIAVKNNRDVFEISGTTDQVDSVERVWYKKDISSLALSTTIYTKYIIRYATEVSSGGLGASAMLDCGAGGTVYLVGSAVTPEYSQGWKVKTGTLPTGKTINYFGFGGLESAAANSNGTYKVWIDFILLFQDWFTLPNYQNLLFQPSPLNDAILSIPGRSVDLIQGLGGGCSEVSMGCDLDVAPETLTWKRPQTISSKTDYNNGDVFTDIAHESGKDELWQWLDFDRGRMRVRFADGYPQFNLDGEKHTVDLAFKEYRYGSGAGEEDFFERYSLTNYTEE